MIFYGNGETDLMQLFENYKYANNMAALVVSKVITAL
jgi:hypothetical protein